MDRNDYLIGVNNPTDKTQQENLLKVREAFLELDRTTNHGRAVLDGYMLPGFEPPTSEFPEATNREIEALLSGSEGLPKCEAS